MEPIDIISKLDEPHHCALVRKCYLPKKDGQVTRVNLRPLNENILREVHLLPKLDRPPAQLTGAQIFINLDANSVL